MGASVPHAIVKATNTGTNIVQTALTDSSGDFVITPVSAGVYSLGVTATGFQTVNAANIEVQVGQIVREDLELKVGEMTTTVEVYTDVPLLSTDSATLGTVMTNQQVTSLPLNGRSFNTLLQLTPGVVIAPSSAGAPGQFSVAGQRTDANNFTVDGVSANFGVGLGPNLGQSGTGSAQAFSALGGSSSLVSVDALQEFRTETSSFAPTLVRESTA